MTAPKIHDSSHHITPL